MQLESVDPKIDPLQTLPSPKKREKEMRVNLINTRDVCMSAWLTF